MKHVEKETNQYKQVKVAYGEAKVHNHPQSIEMKDLKKKLSEAKTRLYQTNEY
ncbi:MAG: hypothetical protein ACPF9F_02730 [Acholeplasmataceae bacterium]